MRREDVTRDQDAAIKKEISPMLGYLNRLKKRMNAVFARDDSLFAEVIDAADALHKLNVSIHYLSCGKTGGSSGGILRKVHLPTVGRLIHRSQAIRPSANRTIR